MVKIKKAFTLIEILIVLGIIGVLVLIGTISFSLSIKTSRDATRRADLEIISSLLEEYKNRTGTYPVNLDELKIPNENIYIPTDPKTKNSYTYVPECAEDICLLYTLSTIMEVNEIPYVIDKYGEKNE